MGGFFVIINMENLKIAQLREFIRAGSNNANSETGQNWLETLRSTHDNEPALLNERLEQEINEGKHGDQIRAILLKTKQFSGEQLTREEQKFLVEKRDLLY